MSTPFDLLRQRIAADVTAQLPAGTFNVSVDQLAKLFGCHPGHIRNQISKSSFPIESIMMGSRRLFPITLIIDYLVSLIASTQRVRPVMGRPTKTKLRLEKEEAASLGLSVAELRAQQKIGGI